MASEKMTVPFAWLQLVFELGEPPPQIGVLGLQLGDAIQELLPVVHDGAIVPEIAETEKRKCLTVTTPGSWDRNTSSNLFPVEKVL
jgi:hypothetical protein